MKCIDLIEALALKYFDTEFRNSALECMIEIATIKDHGSAVSDPNTANEKLCNMFMAVLQKSMETVFNDNSFEDLNRYMVRNDDNRAFINFLTNFLVGMIRNHRNMLENAADQTRDALSAAVKMLVNISAAEDSTIFQICVDFWEIFARELDKQLPHSNNSNFLLSSNDLNNNNSNSNSNSRSANPLYQLYSDALSDLKYILMAKLPRPKEVLVVEDDHGNVIKQEMKDTFLLNQHRQMSQTLHLLARLDAEDTRKVIGSRLEQFNQNNQSINFADLNSLCWSIGMYSMQNFFVFFFSFFVFSF